MSRLLLASESPRRRELLAAAGYDFAVMTRPVAELTEWPSPEELPLVNALLKARAVASEYPDALVIGADTVIVAGGRIIGKPRDLADARRILLELSGRCHRVITGVALRRAADDLCRAFAVATRVWFKNFPPEVADAYLAKVEVLDKAGAYALQEYRDMIVDRVEGSEANVIGLPVEALRDELNRLSPQIK